MPIMRIYKHTLEVTDSQVVRMSKGARLLHVAEQRGELCLWTLVDITAEDVSRYIYIVGTGNPANVALTTDYVGTAQMMNGALVWHVFAGEEFTVGAG